MALGQTSTHADFYFNDIMQHSKNDRSKLNSVDKINGAHPAEKSPSMLYAMQSVFREKMAMKMNNDKKNNRTKHKRIEPENSLLELCEKRQNMVKKYNENCKENNHKEVSSKTTNRLKKLPPITSQHNSKNTQPASNISKKPFSKTTSNFSNHKSSDKYSPQPNMYSTPHRNHSTVHSNDVLKYTQDKNLEESPPDVSKLRLVRNKRKHELLKLNTKHASPKNYFTDEDPPSNDFHKSQTKRSKEKLSFPNKVSVKSTFVSAETSQPMSDFQTWQAERNKERQERLTKHHNSTKHLPFSHQPQNLPDSDTRKPFSTRPVQKNTKIKHQFASSSPNMHNPADEGFYNNFSNQMKEENLQSKSAVNSDHRGLIVNRKTDESPSLYYNQMMPGLQKPVLVRHDGRSNNSSRTSTRSTFYSQTKAIPPMEGGRNVVENFASSESGWSKDSKANVLVNYETASAIPEQEDVVLAPCRICGRKFRVDRINKHIAVCSKASKKKRRVFNMAKVRKKGTELEKFTVPKRTSSYASQNHARKTNWRAQHEDFIKTIRHAKMVTNYVKEGGNLSDLPPPEPSQNPDYVTCDFCQRRFAPNVAERHIPRCKDIKARPAPPKSKIQKNKR